MQIRIGTCTVVNGDNRVVFDETDLTDAKAQLDLGMPVWFSLDIIPGSSFVYQVATITTPADSDSEEWELTVVGIISDDDGIGLTYCVHKDFTARRGYPILSPHDVQTAQIMARFATMLDAVSGGTNSYDKHKVQQDALHAAPDYTTPMSVSAQLHSLQLESHLPRSGSSIFTQKILLPIALRYSGDRCSMVAKVRDTSLGAFGIYSSQDDATALLTFSPEGENIDIWADFVFDEDAGGWYLEKSGYTQPGTGTYTPSTGSI